MLISLLREYLRPYARPASLAVMLQFLQTLATLYLPTLNADLIDNGVVKADTGYIMRIGGVMMAVTVAQIGCAVAAVQVAARTSMGVGRDVRAGIFGRVLDFSAREVGQFGAPSLITRTTNDVQQVQMLLLLSFTLAVSAPIMCIGGILLAMHQDLPLSASLLVIVPVLVLVVGIIVSQMRPLFRTMQVRIDLLNRILREQIAGVRVVRAFVRDRHEQRRFGAANAELRDVSIRVGQLMALTFPAVMLVINVSSVAILWFGGHRIDTGGMPVGALTAFLAYLMQILFSVMMATFMLVMLPRAEVSAERIREVLDTPSSVRRPSAPVELSAPRGQLELAGVEFRYPGAQVPVLRGVDLVAGPGETVAVVGGTGSGKSTLVNLVPRLFDVTDGTVRIDGVDVRQLAPDVLAAVVGLVPQRPYLFSGTVASNLRYGRPDATDADLWQALTVAQARDFVERMPGQLDAAVGQGGSTLSGGQRQRLAIARVLVSRPKVYLFDDSFSALDYATDAALRAALAEETEDATVVIVAQRVSTIRDADRIVVLDEGRVVGTGTHAELMQDNATYREIVLSQLTAQEAAASRPQEAQEAAV